MMPGTPHQVFELLMDSTQHSALTGGQTKINRRVGGQFSIFDGWAVGTNIELVKDKKIVQLWRGADWPIGHYSTAIFTLRPAPGGQTKLLFNQTDVPIGVAKAIAQGWRDYYWAPMKEVLRST